MFREALKNLEEVEDLESYLRIGIFTFYDVYDDVLCY